MEVCIAPRTGLVLRNPLISASGTMGYETEPRGGIRGAHFGAVVCKGTTLLPRRGNPPPRLLATFGGTLNFIGLANIGVEALIARMAPMWARWDTPVLVNVSGASIDEYRWLALRLDGVSGIAGVELNISCPNVERGIEFGVDPDLAGAVTRAVREETGLPLIVKLSPNVTDIRPVARAVEEAGSDAISLINTVSGTSVDARTATSVSGGLSGPAVKPVSLRMVEQVAREVSIPVIGIGGISSAKDVIEFLLAGATAVEIGTALLADPGCYQHILADLTRWMRRNHVSDWSQIVGRPRTPNAEIREMAREV
ncbi:MAG: dihydroorotate dehydrogenase [Chloroflexota bacterium]